MTTLRGSALEALYDEVVANYRSCHQNKVYLSDTWAHTLKQKGSVYSLESMRNMLALGSKANSWIDDFNYLIDHTILNLRDPIVKKLLDLGESDFGNPRKDVPLDGRNFSSNFVHNVLYASKIIGAIEERGIHEPVIMEVGGGLAGIAYLLRSYFGDRLTFYVVDLPETLLLQEFYLRACFPNAAVTYKASREAVSFKKGGLNFINAYMLESQDIPINVAINIDSMQEMNREAVEMYLAYFEKNIASNGIFYFQNHYGQASVPVPEPSEYRLDAKWTLKCAEFASQIECCTESEQARLIYLRTDQAEDVETRRLVLRVLWNGFMSGRLPNLPGVIEPLLRLPARFKPREAVPEIGKIFEKNQIPINAKLVSNLLESMYFEPRANAVDVMSSEAVTVRLPDAVADFQHQHVSAVWRAQSSLLKLMKKSEGLSADQVRNEIAGICETQLLPLKDTAQSPFWSAYVSAILMTYGQSEAAKRLLRSATDLSDNVFWLVRFAYLFHRFGLIDETKAVLAKLTRHMNLDYFVALKTAELEHAVGSAQTARQRLSKLQREPVSEPAWLVSLGKTALRVGDKELASQVCGTLTEKFPENGSSLAMSVTESLPTEKARALERAGKQLKESWDDYFKLGQIAALLQGAGQDKLADEAIDRSIELRSNAFLHYFFVGNIYFGAKRFAKADEAYCKALDIKPYLRHIQARSLYCQLSETLRESGAFGKPGDIALVFQRKQDFYHDLGASTK